MEQVESAEIQFSSYARLGKGKGKVYSRTGHEDQEVE
jgi:hypothetical protein